MSYISLRNASMHFGGPLLFTGVGVEIEASAKVGLIGQNGTGKTTLFRILKGELEPTEGTIFRQRGLNLAYQAQEVQYVQGHTVLDELRRVFEADIQRQARLHELEEDLAGSQTAQARERILRTYERLQQEHETRRGYDVERRIATVLSGLGLPESAWSQPIESFSGGERNVIGLAAVILMEPDLMLLDEPSNHLDMEGIEWFIEFIRKSSAAVVMISHNRHLLDATVTEVWELRSRKLTHWTGNYSDFQRQKAEALALQERQYKSQQRWIKRIEFQARRLMDMANAYDDPGQAKRAKAMRMRIEQLDRIERPDTTENRFHASLRGSTRHGHIALEVKGLNLGFTEPNGDYRPLLEDAELTIEYGQRVCLVGPNGSGKSTLFNAILNHASWERPEVEITEGPLRIKGSIRCGKSARTGDYNQFHDRALDESATLISWMMETTSLRFQPASELIHKFLFKRDDLERPIRTLSGGEKSRLQLARLVHERVNFLMLDEPTNHLDIQACEQLEEMLEEFEGTLLVISHDRYFLDKLVNRVIELKGRKLVTCPGTFAQWWIAKHAQISAGAKKTLQLHSQKGAAKSSEAKRSRAEKKARQREQHRLQTELRRIEQKIQKLERRRAELEKQLEQAYTGGEGGGDAQLLNLDFKDITEKLEESYNHWEKATEALDAN